jgi:hypothetical protein
MVATIVIQEVQGEKYNRNKRAFQKLRRGESGE